MTPPRPSAPRPWVCVRTCIEVENRIFTLKTDTSVSPLTGREHDFFLLEAGDWINVVPITDDGRVLLVRQYRHGTREMTLEVPGGLIDPGETPAQAAARELVEETGFRAGRIEAIGRVRPNPALFNNWCYTFLARDLEPVGPEPSADEEGTEDVELVTAALRDIPDMIAREEITHALVIDAFYHFFLAYRPGR
jgi:8-oxo-dGTP pyrophosphatase MutT (NUDIX family)